MGREARCRCTINGKPTEGKLLLETDELIFRGEPRLVVPLKEIDEVAAADGQLKVRSGKNTAVFELADAPKWQKAIQHPPTLMDKLGIKQGSKIVTLGFGTTLCFDGVAYDTALEADSAYDMILVRADLRADLAAVPTIVPQLAPRGALWIVYPKGIKEITESHVFATGKAAGLVDVKVCRFSESHTALKFVPRKV